MNEDQMKELLAMWTFWSAGEDRLREIIQKAYDLGWSEGKSYGEDPPY